MERLKNFMDEFWQQDKLILVIGLFQFGLILFMSILLNSSQRKVFDQVSMKPLPKDKSKSMSDQSSHLLTNQLQQTMSVTNREVNSDLTVITEDQVTTTPSASPSLKVDSLPEVVAAYSIEISPELFKELLEISNNPAATVDEAIRWWLRRRTLDTMKSVADRRDRPGVRSHRSWKSLEESWND